MVCVGVPQFLLAQIRIMLAYVLKGIARAAASSGQAGRVSLVSGQRFYHEKVCIELHLTWAC